MAVRSVQRSEDHTVDYQVRVRDGLSRKVFVVGTVSRGQFFPFLGLRVGRDQHQQIAQAPLDDLGPFGAGKTEYHRGGARRPRLGSISPKHTEDNSKERQTILW